MKRKIIKTIKSLLAALAIIASDQLTKEYFLTSLAFKEQIKVNSILNFILVYNQGISFGFFNDKSSSPLFFIIISSLITLIIFIWMCRTHEERIELPVGMIIGGAIGNIIDRITRGAVVDFIDFNIMGWHYPAFNVADMAICIGVISLLLLPLAKKSN